MENANTTCPACQSGDASHDASSWKADVHGLDESHLDIGLIRCPACGRRALRIWMELIDWQDGDDSQACIIVPLPVDLPLDLTGDLDESWAEALLKRIGPCRFLVRSSPRGSHGDASWHWRNEQPFILPHD